MFSSMFIKNKKHIRKRHFFHSFYYKNFYCYYDFKNNLYVLFIDNNNKKHFKTLLQAIKELI